MDDLKLTLCCCSSVLILEICFFFTTNHFIWSFRDFVRFSPFFHFLLFLLLLMMMIGWYGLFKSAGCCCCCRCRFSWMVKETIKNANGKSATHINCWYMVHTHGLNFTFIHKIKNEKSLPLMLVSSSFSFSFIWNHQKFKHPCWSIVFSIRNSFDTLLVIHTHTHTHTHYIDHTKPAEKSDTHTHISDRHISNDIEQIDVRSFIHSFIFCSFIVSVTAFIHSFICQQSLTLVIHQFHWFFVFLLVAFLLLVTKKSLHITWINIHRTNRHHVQQQNHLFISLYAIAYCFWSIFFRR